MEEIIKVEVEAGELAEAAEEAALSKVKGLVNPDYLSWLLDELVFERNLSGTFNNGKTIETIREMIMDELDRWGLGKKQELELAAILAERNGLERQPNRGARGLGGGPCAEGGRRERRSRCRCGNGIAARSGKGGSGTG